MRSASFSVLAAAAAVLFARSDAGPQPQDTEQFRVHAVSQVIELDGPPPIAEIKESTWRRLAPGSDYSRDTLRGYLTVPLGHLNTFVVDRLDQHSNGVTIDSSHLESIHVHDVNTYLEEVGVYADADSPAVQGLTVTIDEDPLDVILDPIYTLPGSRIWLASEEIIELVPMVHYYNEAEDRKESYLVVGAGIENQLGGDGDLGGATVTFEELTSVVVRVVEAPQVPE